MLAFLACVAGLVTAHFSNSLRDKDFPDFFCAARMLAEGHGHQLYDAGLQRQYQARFAGRVGTLYIHPPFEALIYLTVSWLPMKRAYVLWNLLNVVFLAGAVRTVTRETSLVWNWSILLAASFTFVPILLCFLQGQDSVLLLLLFSLAFAALRRERDFAAGCWLGLGLFKFQLVLPLVLVLAMQRGQRRFLQGFLLVALALAALSAGVSGWSVFSVYPKFLLHLQEQPFAGIVPHAMANFRGLTFLLLRSDRTSFAIVAVVTLSLAAFAMTVFAWRSAGAAPSPGQSGAFRGVLSGEQFDQAFATTVLFALLVSYHLNPHDLSLLLLPMGLLLRYGWQTPRPLTLWTILVVSAILFLPPLHLFALQTHAYAFICLPLIALFVVSAVSVRKTGAPTSS